MLQIVNKDLITIKTVEKPAENGHDAFTIDEYYPTDQITIDPEVHPNFVRRPVARVYCFDKDGHFRLSFRENKNTGKMQTQLSITNKAKYEGEAFLLAIPFCGILVPVPESNYIRIHSATIIRSDEVASVKWGDCRYTTVAYLLVSLNKKAMKADDVDSVNMHFVSYVGKKNNDGDRDYYRNSISVTLGEDGSFDCSDTVVAGTPDPDFTPKSKEDRTKAFTLYNPPKYAPKANTQKKEYRSSNGNRSYSRKDSKGKYN